MPPAYAFEGMRSILQHQVVRYDYMATAFALNILYLALGTALFFLYFRMARRRGSLLQQGE
jgi:ABC-2 type transport system permease protein